jgi:hypothetical protein
MVVLIAFLAFLGLLLIVPFVLEAKRRRALVKVNGSYEIDRAIIDRKLFEGMSTRQLHQAWGPPEEIATRPHRSKRRETWLYGGDGKGRFRDHVEVEDGIVVSWKHWRGHGLG